jgi:uncharacterized protein YggE
MRFMHIPVCAAFTILPLTFAQAQTLAPHTVTVTGTSTIKTAPDYATITVTLTSTGQTSGAALQADKGVLNQLVEAIRPFHVTNNDLQTSNINLTQMRSVPRLPAQDPLQAGVYQVTDRLIVTVDDISKVTAVIDAMTQAAGNAAVSVMFGLKNRAAVEDRAKIEAVANARHQADVLAGAEGAKIDRMVAMSAALAVGNFLPNLNLLGGALGNQDGQIAITQQVVVEYGLQ